MSAFVESSVVPASRLDSHVQPEEQVSFRVLDARLERRELAAKRAKARKEKRP